MKELLIDIAQVAAVVFVVCFVGGFLWVYWTAKYDQDLDEAFPDSPTGSHGVDVGDVHGPESRVGEC